MDVGLIRQANEWSRILQKTTVDVRLSKAILLISLGGTGSRSGSGEGFVGQ
jgi:hypothetical protein